MSRNIYRLLKILHLIGLSLFLGSIFGHIVASVLGGAYYGGHALSDDARFAADTGNGRGDVVAVVVAETRCLAACPRVCRGADCSVGIFCDSACGQRNVAVGTAGRGGTHRANQGGAQGGRYGRRGQYSAGGAGDGLGCG